jgi:hypothetical protein
MSENLDLKHQEFLLGVGGWWGEQEYLSRSSYYVTREFYFHQNCPDRLCCLLSLIVKVYRGYFPWVRQAGREVTHLPPSSGEIKNEWSYTPTPPVYPHDVDKENFALIFMSSWTEQRARRTGVSMITQQKFTIIYRRSIDDLRKKDQMMATGGSQLTKKSMIYWKV